MPRRSVFWAIALLATAAAAWQCCALRWTCDDAYISFRYAQHFVEGHGLVFNRDPNEAPVEGYTNFTWTLWLALGMKLGCTGDAIETWSIAWGTLCHAATVLLLAGTAWRASDGQARVPVAACGWAALHHGASLAPAGLETALFVLLVTAMLRSVLVGEGPRGALLAGALGVLAAMTRPDGALFAAVVGAFVLHDAWRYRAWRIVPAYAAPFVLVFFPYLLWRHSYYGLWVPNTFYAKSADDPYPGQGLLYVWEFLKCYWVLLPVLVLPIVGLALRRTDAPNAWLAGRRPWLAVLGFVVPYVGFVVWVGGDFMFGRFLLPILPALLLSLDVACLRWRPSWAPMVGGLLVGGLVLRAEPAWLADAYNRHGFSDNRAISVRDSGFGMPWTELLRASGHYLNAVLAGLDVRIGFVGSQANLAYRSRVPVAIECTTGLTDARLGRQPVVVRGTVGHEKGYAAHLDYLIHERRLQLMFDLDFKKGEPHRDIIFPLIPGRLVTYDRALLRELKKRDPNITFDDFEQVLDAYLAELPKKTKDQVRTDLKAFRSFYFDHNDDPARLARFEEFLR